MRWLGLLLATALLLFGMPACESPTDQPQFTIARRPIINGQVDTTHTSVVALVSWAQQFCTGTVIAPRAILTAGHCIRESGIPTSAMDIFFGQTVGQGGTLISVADAHVHPQYYLASNGAPINDIAVVILQSDAPVPPMAWQQDPLPTVTGKTVTLVGYGVTDAYSQTGNGTRRSVDQTISDVDSMFIYYQGYNSGTCQGDSGGPMLLNENGRETVLGVTSFGDPTCVALGANTRTDIYASFVTQYAGNSVGQVQPVTVAITAPANGAEVPSTFTVSVDAQSPVGVAAVELYVDDVLAEVRSSPPWSFQIASLPDGNHALRARAEGQDGGTGEATIQVTVSAALGACSPENPCRQGYDCIDGECIPHTPEGGCSEERPCLPGFQCVDGLCQEIPPPPPGTTGAPCAENSDCNSGMCVDGTTDHGFCTEECATDQDCPNEAACLDMGGLSLCGPPYSALPTGLGPSEYRELTGGCQAAPRRGAAGLFGLLLVVGLAGAAGQRRRRACRAGARRPG